MKQTLNARTQLVIYLLTFFISSCSTENTTGVKPKSLDAMFRDFVNRPDICDIETVTSRLQLRDPKAIASSAKTNLSFSSPALKSAFYSTKSTPRGERATMSLNFDDSKVCIEENQLNTSYGKGNYIHAIDKTYTVDEINNPQNYTRQVVFHYREGEFFINAIINPNQCVQTIVIEQNNCKY